MKQININQIKGIEKLYKAFDNVIHEQYENYQTLELSNNVKRGIIEKEVYLKLSIAQYTANRNAIECLEGAINSLLPWLELLINCDEKPNNEQLCLFGSSVDDELEKEPETPTSSDDNSWSRYFRKVENVRISNMKKKYKFFELFNPICWWWAYHTLNYKKFIPSNEELENHIKLKILEYKDKPGRYKEVWFDTYRDIFNKSMSDIELYNCVLGAFRFYLVPFKEKHGVFFDNSYTIHSEPSEEITYMFYFSMNKLNIYYSPIHNIHNSEDFKEYDFYNPSFISFLRETFNVKECEPLNDDIVRERVFKIIFDEITIKWKEILNNSSSYKVFKKALMKKLKNKISKVGHFTEEYSFECNICTKQQQLIITQRKKQGNY